MMCHNWLNDSGHSILTTTFDQNNSFLSVKFKVQLRSSRNCLHRLQGLMTGKDLLSRLNVTVQLVKQFIKLCACELIMCGINALKVEGPDLLLATGMDFAVLFLSEMAHKSCHCLSSSASSWSSKDWIFLWPVTFAIDNLSRFAFFILLMSVCRHCDWKTASQMT